MCARPLEFTPAKTSLEGWKTTTLWMEVMTSPPVTSTAEGFFAPSATLYRCTCTYKANEESRKRSKHVCTGMTSGNRDNKGKRTLCCAGSPPPCQNQSFCKEKLRANIETEENIRELRVIAEGHHKSRRKIGCVIAPLEISGSRGIAIACVSPSDRATRWGKQRCPPGAATMMALHRRSDHG